MQPGLFPSSPLPPQTSPLWSPSPPTLQANTKTLLCLQIHSTCHPTDYSFIPETGRILSLGQWREEWGWGGQAEEAGGALSLSLCLTPWSELIHPSEPCQALTAGFTRRPTWRGGCWAARGQRWCPESLGQLLGAGLVLLIVTPSAPTARPGHGRCLLNAHRGLGMGGWVDGSQACSFVAISCVPWRCEGGVGRARI